MAEIKPWLCLDCRVLMVLVDEDHCKCPQCKTEVWFRYDQREPKTEELMMPGNVCIEGKGYNYANLMKPEHLVIKGGSKSSNKRTKKREGKQRTEFVKNYQET